VKSVSLPLRLIIAATVVLGLVSTLARKPHKPEEQIVNRPVQIQADGFVSSSACQACHPSQYNSWYGSYHRTMTQIATPETVIANFDDVYVSDVHGDTMHLEQRGNEFWATFTEPDSPKSTINQITRQVVMITGSHHQQIYWYSTGHDRALNVLPGVYIISENKWVPRSAVVLHPPNQSLSMTDGHWNAICLACHTTHPKTQFRAPFLDLPIEDQAVDTTVAEFGIACEACHGPATEHIQKHQNPLTRYRSYLSDEPDSSIVEPSSLSPQRSSQVCGQCHSVWEFYDSAGERHANAEGFPYSPGDELRETRFIPQPMKQLGSQALNAFVAKDPDFVAGSFWPDGMIRVSGREYNGLIDSPCFTNTVDHNSSETLSCFSCHNMHKSTDDPRPISTWADTHQVASDMDTNEACLQCHDTFRTNVAQHTGHAQDSTGSLCYNCHMPYSSYGLLKAVRSHTISSPSISETIEYGRPNACNLCHLDKTLSWTGAVLEERYQIPIPELNKDEEQIAASLLWAMKGDAGQRALTTWAFGWAPAQKASGTSWMTPHLLELLNDPYEAIRFIAYRSLRQVSGYETLEYNYLDSRENRIKFALPLLQSWQASQMSRQRRDPELLVGNDGNLLFDEFRRILNQRDNRPIFLRE
tara:strand:+ start:1620 stop:3545 length:1926 start_codon:yes stop_codon:yes gene_type:complete